MFHFSNVCACIHHNLIWVWIPCFGDHVAKCIITLCWIKQLYIFVLMKVYRFSHVNFSQKLYLFVMLIYQGVVIFHDVFDNEYNVGGAQIRVEGVYIWPYRQLRMVANRWTPISCAAQFMCCLIAFRCLQHWVWEWSIFLSGLNLFIHTFCRLLYDKWCLSC